ncbi:MAG TPA: sterol desaturase family protein [Sphingomonas sp.]
MEVAVWEPLRDAIVGTAYVVLVCVAIEHIASIERYRLRDRLSGSVLVLTGTVLSSALSWPLQQLWFAMEVGFLVVPLWTWVVPLGLFGQALAILFFVMLSDFFRYWRHRAEHRWFWSIHKVHHAPTELHAANSIGHPLQTIPDFLFVSIPLSLFEFPGATIPLAIGFLTSFLTFYIHSPIDFHFGPMRRVVVDNRFHRIHHSLEVRHFDKNFGICFSVWDSLFGTAHWPKASEWPKVGIEGEPPPRTIRQFLMMPFVSGGAISSGQDQESVVSAGDKINAKPIARLDPLQCDRSVPAEHTAG